MTPPSDNSDPRDYVLDLSSVGASSAESASRRQDAATPKAKYLSIYFRCCNVYAPIYKNAAGTAYAGHCPRCRRAATIAIGADGTKSRIFQAE